MGKKYDWDHWRHLYVSGGDEVTLEALSGTKGAPSLNGLKKRSRRESWTSQRKEFRHQAYTKTSTKTLNALGVSAGISATEEAIAKIDKLVDIAEMITRHSRTSQAMLIMCAKAMKSMKPEDLTPAQISQWVKTATDIERLAAGLATASVDIDVTQLTDEELDRIISNAD